MKKILITLMLFSAFCLQAMEQEEPMTEPGRFFVRYSELCGQEFEVVLDHEDPKQNHVLHRGEIDTILISHMVSGPFDRPREKLRSYGEKIAWHYCLGAAPDEERGEICFYEARPLEIMPAIVLKKNNQVCSVALIMNTCEKTDKDQTDPSININEKIIDAWGKFLAGIAMKLGFEELVWGLNIKGQKDLDPKYDRSPGPQFEERRVEIIDRANAYLTRGILTPDRDFALRY